MLKDPDDSPDVAPSDFSPEKFFRGIQWHQRWELFRGVFTPGAHSVDRACRHIHLPSDLSGKRVLDIGAWNGCFSFECERRGAAEVVALSLKNPEVTGFNKIKNLLDSKIIYVQDSVYTLSPDVLGDFDIVLFLGVLYHLRYPLLAVDRIRTICRGAVLIETHVVTDELLVRKPFNLIGKMLLLSRLLKSTPIWRQYRAYEAHPEDSSNWFGPNIQAVTESFDSAGFDTTHLESWGKRASFRAEIKDELPERLLTGSYEGLSSTNARLAGIPQRRTRLYEDTAK